MPATEAQKRARKRWDNKNKEVIKKINYRSKAKRYIIELADVDELKDLEILIKNRLIELKSTEKS